MTKTRTTKTAQQRAEEALGVAQRAVDRLVKERAKHRAAAERLTPQIEAAEKRLAYVAANPDLPPPPSAAGSTSSSTGPTGA